MSAAGKRLLGLRAAVLGAAALAIWAASGAVPALAASGPPAPPFTVSVLPAAGRARSYFVVSARPGAKLIAGGLLLTNRGGRPLVVLLDPVGALTASNLGSAYELRGAPVRGPSSWIRLAVRSVRLAPRASARVGVAVAVPPGIAAGEYLSGVSVQAQNATTSSARAGGNVAVSSTIRYAIGVEVVVPGPLRPRLLLTGAALQRRPAGLAFIVAAVNPGNVILDPVRGAVTVSQGRRLVGRYTVGPGTFVTGTTLALPVLAPREQPVQGTVYHLHAALTYAGGVATLDRDLTFGAGAAAVQHEFGGPPPAPAAAARASGAVRRSSTSPWAAAAGGAAGAAAVAFALWLVLLVRRRRSGTARERPDEV